MRSAFYGLIVLFAPAAVAQTLVVNFTAPGNELRSPNGAMRVYSVDLPAKRDEVPWHSLRLEYPDHRSEQLDAFLRNVDVSWSSDGSMLFVSDYMGSNIAECYLVKPARGGARKTNLTDVLNKSSPRLAGLMKRADHTYVECERWVAPDKIRVVAVGHGGRNANWFEYRYVFAYDAKHNTAEQIEGSVKKVP